MADRYLIWTYPSQFYPKYYIDNDSRTVGVRKYAEVAPGGGDFNFDILADGYSILGSNGTLPKGLNSDDGESGDELTDTVIENGSWVSFNPGITNGCNNITIILELNFEE